MKQNRYAQIRVIHDEDPSKFQEKFNAAQVELQSQKPETIKMDITSRELVAIIQFIVETEEPENARDELSLQGINFTCKQCPKFEPRLNKDGSVNRTAKKGKCFLSDWAWADSSVTNCEWFCKKYLKGEIEPIGGAE